MPKISVGLSYPGWQGPDGSESREKPAPPFSCPAAQTDFPPGQSCFWEGAGEALARPAFQEPGMELESEEGEAFAGQTLTYRECSGPGEEPSLWGNNDRTLGRRARSLMVELRGGHQGAPNATLWLGSCI